jgi:hypothetical protein
MSFGTKAVVKALAAICIFTGLIAASTAQSSNSIKPAASLSVVTKALSAALDAKTLKGDTDPSLIHFPYSKPWLDYEGGMLKAACDPQQFARIAMHPVPCFYGLTQAHHTIVLFGDSFAGSWGPAVAIAAKSLGYRLAFFEFQGCLTPFVNPTPGLGETEAQVRLCIDWHRALPAAVRKLHPVAILAANGTRDWGSADKNYISGMMLAFNEMTLKSPSTTRIIIGTGPHLPASGPMCVAAHPTDLRRCDFKYKPGTSNLALALTRDAAAAKAAHAKLIPTIQWQCLNGACPVVVHDFLVYIDADHITTAYSQWLSTLMTQALRRSLSN